MSFERVLRWSLVSIAVAGLAAGIAAYAAGRQNLADRFRSRATCWPGGSASMRSRWCR
jgi:hypothetical protein